ncbi:MAG: ArsR/SmtB family transcription factor [Solirubrobacteraceae bacterium]
MSREPPNLQAPSRSARARDLVNHHPRDVTLQAALGALADPVRRAILYELADDADWARACGSFDLGVAKSTVSHHCNVLRTAGLIEQRDVGSRRLNRLRRGEYDARFPGLLALVLDERER